MGIKGIIVSIDGTSYTVWLNPEATSEIRKAAPPELQQLALRCDVTKHMFLANAIVDHFRTEGETEKLKLEQKETSVAKGSKISLRETGPVRVRVCYNNSKKKSGIPTSDVQFL